MQKPWKRQRNVTTEQSKHYRNEKETVKTLLRDYPANGKIGAKSLKHLLRESKRLFLQTKLAADTLDETGKPLPKGYEWVADNAYVLTEKFSLLPSEFCFHKALQRENQTVDPLPRYYLVFMKYMEFLERNGFAFDDSALAAFFALSGFVQLSAFIQGGGCMPDCRRLPQSFSGQLVTGEGRRKVLLLFFRFAKVRRILL